MIDYYAMRLYCDIFSHSLGLAGCLPINRKAVFKPRLYDEHKTLDVFIRMAGVVYYWHLGWIIIRQPRDILIQLLHLSAVL